MVVSAFRTLHFKFDQAYFIPGRQLSGQAYLHLEENYPGNQLSLKITGTELTQFKHHTNGEHGGTTQLLKGENEFINQSFMVYQFQGAHIPAG